LPPALWWRGGTLAEKAHSSFPPASGVRKGTGWSAATRLPISYTGLPTRRCNEMDTTEENRRKNFFEDLNAKYIELQKDPETWEAFQAELKLWDATLMDGLDRDEIWDPETRTAHSRSEIE
jgi:hypothetical protein